MTRQEDSFLQMTIMICYLYVIWTDGERGVEFPERKGLHPLTTREKAYLYHQCIAIENA
jgi:hypothetical protein